jgi:hypothetical protein
VTWINKWSPWTPRLVDALPYTEAIYRTIDVVCPSGFRRTESLGGCKCSFK